MRFLRRAFVGGLVLLLPTVVTIWVFWKLFIWLDQLLRPLLDRYLPWQIPGLGFLAVLLIIVLAGFLASSFLGRQFSAVWGRVIRRLPLVGKVFHAVDRLLSVFQEQDNFKGVVCFQYPRKGIWSLGFVTNRSQHRIHGLSWEDEGLDRNGLAHKKGDSRELLHIFVPTSPNPTSGFFLMLPVDEVSYPEISVEQALNVIVSGGAILPDDDKPSSENES
ncbi:DUF502 domain-containing protein [bacterium]|nr:DUF502 domain-containing protein [bacterium]